VQGVAAHAAVGRRRAPPGADQPLRPTERRAAILAFAKRRPVQRLGPAQRASV